MEQTVPCEFVVHWFCDGVRFERVVCPSGVP